MAAKREKAPRFEVSTDDGSDGEAGAPPLARPTATDRRREAEDAAE